ncbi:MAG: cobalamin-dependent protein [Elusimicrobia bacterium]|nr:cobalamin-dependent protein [Elusimicrobiota bacterium]
MLKIYISDLTHNYKTVSNETMPLNAAYIKAYLKKNLDDKVDCKLFRYPDILIDNIRKYIPDVVMLSNYVWNEALGLFILSFVKKINPNILTIMGGPNFSLDREKQEEYMCRNSNLDFYILGEGEIPSSEIIKLFIDNNKSVKKLKSHEIDSCVYIRPDGSFYQGKRIAGVKNLDDIPSVWLSGYLDEFFDGKLAPLIETTRGCFFTCAYCVQGTEFYSKIRRFSLERIKKEIVYIAEKIRKNSPDVGFLSIADSNFGIFNDDVEISKIINEVQEKYGWPTFIDATTGNNKKDSTFQTVVNLNGALVMYNSVQSMSPVVLKNINRKNINPEIMKDIQQRAKEMGIKTLTETILSLPGETFESHRDGLFQLINLNIKQFTNYQCMMLKGSYLETQEFRKRFNINTRYRILPRNFGIYNGNKVFEVEEIISSTSTLPFSDYLKARKLHLILIIYYNGFRFEPLIRLMEFYGVDIISWLNELFENMNKANKNVTNLVNAFLDETTNELFYSYEKCAEFYAKEDNFQRLLKGEIGGNLIMKYLSIATFHTWEDIVEYAFNVARKLITNKETNKDIYNFLNDLEVFMRYRLANGKSSAQILSNAEADLHYDVKAWVDNNYADCFNKYRFKNPSTVQFYLPEERYRIIKNALSVYGEDITGKAKLVTRIQYTDQLREYRTLRNITEK